MRSISLYADNGSWLTRLHPFTKCIYVLSLVLTAVLSGNLWVYGGLILVSILLLLSGRVLRKALPLLAFSGTILLTIFLIHGLFNQNNSQLLFQAGPLKFYLEGCYYALKISLNILNILLSFAVFVLTTNPADLVEEMERAGLSPKYGYVAGSVLQILPQMMGTKNTIMDAQRSRGMETEGNLFVRAKAFIPLISPVVMSSLINIKERAIALEVRGFDSREKKTFLTERKRSGSDKVISLFLLLLMTAGAVWRVYLWLS